MKKFLFKKIKLKGKFFKIFLCLFNKLKLTKIQIMDLQINIKSIIDN